MAKQQDPNRGDAHGEASDAGDPSLRMEPPSSRRVIARDGVVAYVTASIGALLAGALPVANATFSISRCCTLAVGMNYADYDQSLYPWEICNFNVDVDYSSNITYQSVMVPMSWAKQYCRGAQYSGLDQWLQPLAAYISPYIGILLLCPVGEVDELPGVRGRLATVINAVRMPLQEYVSILGDPGSAVFGAFSEIWSDARTLSKLTTDTPDEQSWLRRRALWVTAMAGDNKFTEKTGWRDAVRRAVDQTGNPTTGPSTAETGSGGDKGGAAKAQDPIEVEKAPARLGSVVSLAPRVLDAAGEVDRAIEVVLTARGSFANGILIPILLTLAVTAATFYDAYGSIGDKNTGLALAYCVWYSWILVVGVAGNCFATAISSELSLVAFRSVLKFGKKQSVALRDRYVNNQLWESWAHSARDQDPPRDEDSPDRNGLASYLETLQTNWRFWARFSGGQLLGFSCVAFTSACATAIAWNTPTVGLGCRSFNFILYMAISFVVCVLNVLLSWLSVSAHRYRMQKTDHPRIKMALLGVQCVYWFLVFGNSLVMVLGTVFHLVGVFRTCWCERLTWTDSTMVELNSKTEQAVDNARRYWISTAYVAFGVVWVLCLTAIGFRAFIVSKIAEMTDWLEKREETEAGRPKMA